MLSVMDADLGSHTWTDSILDSVSRMKLASGGRSGFVFMVGLGFSMADMADGWMDSGSGVGSVLICDEVSPTVMGESFWTSTYSTYAVKLPRGRA